MSKSDAAKQSRRAAAGLDVHGPELVAHKLTLFDDDGNADIELNIAFPLTAKRHEQLMHMLEEGYSEHEAYVLLAGGEILEHMESLKKSRRAASGPSNAPKIDKGA